jgi:hypothetical protein
MWLIIIWQLIHVQHLYNCLIHSLKLNWNSLTQCFIILGLSLVIYIYYSHISLLDTGVLLQCDMKSVGNYHLSVLNIERKEHFQEPNYNANSDVFNWGKGTLKYQITIQIVIYLASWGVKMWHWCFDQPGFLTEKSCHLRFVDVGAIDLCWA